MAASRSSLTRFFRCAEALLAQGGEARGALAYPHGTLNSIQAGRGIAALLVALFHAERALSLPQYLGHDAVGGMTGFGHAGVEFFFVLSGFIICYVHGADLGRPAAVWRYAWRRVSRIYPPYWVVTALLLAVTAASHGLDALPKPVHAAESLLLLPYGPEPVLGPAWTLQREVVFYLLFGLAIVNPRLAALGVAAYLGASLVPRWAAWPFGDLGASWYDASFVVGLGCAWITRRRRLPWPLLTASLGAAVFLAAGLSENAGLLPTQGAAGHLLYGLASGAVIAGLARAELNGRLRVGRVLAFLGAASYSFYLVHSPVLGYAARALSVLGLLDKLPDSLALVLVVAAAVFAGIGFHVWVERPLTKLARHLGSLRRRPPWVSVAG